MPSLFLDEFKTSISKNRVLYLPQGNIKDLKGEIYSQDNTFYKWGLGYGNEQSVLSSIKNTITDPDYLAHTSKPLKLTDIISATNQYSVVKIIMKKMLMDRLSLADVAKKARTMRLISRVNSSVEDEDKNRDNFDKLINEAGQFAKDKILGYIDTVFIDSIIALHVHTMIYNKETDEVISINDFLKQIEPDIDSVKSELGIQSNDDNEDVKPADYLKILNRVNNDIDFVNKYEEQIHIELVLNKYITNELEGREKITFKMDRLATLISRDLVRVAIFEACIDDASIQCENLLNTIKQKLWEMQFTAPTAYIDIIDDMDPHEILDILMTSNDIVFKQDFNKHLEEIGYGFCNKKLQVGSSLIIRTIFLPNISTETKTINLERFNSDGKYFIILERHISASDARIKIFQGTFTELMVKIPTFIKDNEKILVTDSLLSVTSTIE